MHDCIGCLSNLGQYEFNYSVNSPMVLELPVWVGPSEAKEALSSFTASGDTRWGDVFAAGRGLNNSR